MTDLQFIDLNLSDSMLATLRDMGYQHPTLVQQSAIPMARTGRDLMVQSQTGTGKTAAFGIPIIENIDPDAKFVRALILSPTRELAKQVADELTALGRRKRIQTVAVYGGASMDKQIAEMRFAQIVVGTPGRIVDHLHRRTLHLDHVQMLVLDEADEMLSMGFAHELSQIMEHLPEKRQTMLFSATMPEDIRRLAKRSMKEPEFISLVEENVAADGVEHHYYMVSGVSRPRDLIQVLEYEEPESAIIFTNTRKDSEIVCKQLKRLGYDAEYLNSDLPQREREEIMARVKQKNLRFLVATDIAARGIDISELSHVVNYVLPESPEVYIHRTGRTGRAGHKGIAISLIGPREIGVYYYLKRIYNVALQERTVPTQAEIELRRDERKTEALVNAIFAATDPIQQDPELRAQSMRLLEREDAPEIVMALLKIFKQPRARSLGGMLEEVPKPDHLEPGSLPQTLAGVAERVAIVQSEFRGIPVEKRKVTPQPQMVYPKLAQPLLKSDPELKAAEKPAPKPQSSETRLFCNLGKADHFTDQTLSEKLCEIAGLMPEDIESVEIHNHHCYVNVQPECAEDLLAIDGEWVGSRSIHLEIAQDEA